MISHACPTPPELHVREKKKERKKGGRGRDACDGGRVLWEGRRRFSAGGVFYTRLNLLGGEGGKKKKGGGGKGKGGKGERPCRE